MRMRPNIPDDKLDEFKPNWRSPPGDTIREVMKARGIESYRLARALELSEPDLERLLVGRIPLTAKLAHLLSRELGSSEDFWITRELHYREPLSPPIPAGSYCVRCEGSGWYCPDCGSRTCVCPADMRPLSVQCEHDRAALRPLGQVPGEQTCDHLPALSEPTMTLHCTRCGAWLKTMTVYIACSRDEADIGTCSHSDEAWEDGYCPNCETELDPEDKPDEA